MFDRKQVIDDGMIFIEYMDAIPVNMFHLDKHLCNISVGILFLVNKLSHNIINYIKKPGERAISER